MSGDSGEPRLAFAAAKALETRVHAEQQRIDALEMENAELRQRLERIETLMLEKSPQ